MPRFARIKTDTKTYHAMVRGVNKQIIFEDDEDRHIFIKLLDRYRRECRIKLFAYCLMDNHVHLVLQETEETLDMLFRKQNTAYAMYFNQKYCRCGHLFQDRFKSEPIINDAQLLQTIRYVHRNPVKAGICKSPEDYMFSSYKEYLGNRIRICDTQFIISMFGSVESFIEFNEESSDYECLENQTGRRNYVNDEAAKQIIRSLTDEPAITFFQSLEKKQRDNLISELKEQHLSNAQISRITGLSPWIVTRAKRDGP